MQYKLNAVVDETQGLDYESYLILQCERDSFPHLLTDFIGGIGRFVDGYAVKDYSGKVRSVNGRLDAVEIDFGTATWLLATEDGFVVGQTLLVSGGPRFNRLIIRLIK